MSPMSEQQPQSLRQASSTTREAASGSRRVARVGSIAEAGYLVSLLESASITAESRPVESFSAVTGAWSASHEVRVAESDADVAAALLRAEARGEDLEPVLAGVAADPAAANGSVNPWRMLAVLSAIVVTGTLLVQKNLGDGPRVRQPNDRVDGERQPTEPESRLAAALRQSPATYYSSADPAGARRRLSFSQRTQAWTLSTDEDGDGRYEKHRRFAAMPPVAAAAIDR
ncbi:MAG: hypothetical protein AAF266_09705 [Planctomycetota bacterium]